MTGRHNTDARSRAPFFGALVAIGAVIAAVAWIVVAGPFSDASKPVAGTPQAASAPTSAASSSAVPAPPARPSPKATATTAAPSSPAAPSAAPTPSRATSEGPQSNLAVKTVVRKQVSRAAANAAVAKLVSGHRKGSVSVALLNTHTGVSYSDGATSGMVEASVIKLDLLETMLLRHQKAHTALSSSEKSEAAAMIEHSSNSAADWVFNHSDGALSGTTTANKTLGTTHTKIGTDDYWGLSTTYGVDQVALLKNLVYPNSPLTAANKKYALGLLSHVESDQRWGVGAATDKGTGFVNKNGWLGIDDDGGLWAVNSVGIITVNGQRVLIAVMTQHNSSFGSGVTLNQAVAKAVATVVAAPPK